MSAKLHRHRTKTQENFANERVAQFAFLYSDLRDNITAVSYESNLAGKEMARFCVRAGLGGHERDQAVFLFTTLSHVGVWVKQIIEQAQTTYGGKIKDLNLLMNNLTPGTSSSPPWLNVEPYLVDLRGFYMRSEDYSREKLRRIYLVNHPRDIKTRVSFDEHRTVYCDELIQGVLTLEMARHAGSRIKMSDFKDKVSWYNNLLDSIQPVKKRA